MILRLLSEVTIQITVWLRLSTPKILRTRCIYLGIFGLGQFGSTVTTLFRSQLLLVATRNPESVENWANMLSIYTQRSKLSLWKSHQTAKNSVESKISTVINLSKLFDFFPGVRDVIYAFLVISELKWPLEILFEKHLSRPRFGS